MTLIIGVRFRRSGKTYYFDPDGLQIKKGDHVLVETARGIEFGTVSLAPKEMEDDKIVQPLKKVIRLATPEDDSVFEENVQLEKEAFEICLKKIKNHGLDMKLIDCEYTFDRNKLLFYFTADGRIDFRELVKDLASVFRTRIELRQIGVRDETKLLGGMGMCGRPLCCHTYLTDFVPVSIKMAKEQNLSLNPAKISGVCGRLMCCLKNVEEAYEYLNRSLPNIGAKVTTPDGFTGEVWNVSVLKQKVKVIITKANDEKEILEYPADELYFEDEHRMANRKNSDLPEEELDEVALRELEQLENEDIEENTDEKASSEASSKSSHSGRKPHYKNKRQAKNEPYKKQSPFHEEEELSGHPEKTSNKSSRNKKNANYRGKNKSYRNHKTH